MAQMVPKELHLLLWPMSVEVAEACGAWEIAPIVDSQNIEKIYSNAPCIWIFAHGWLDVYR